MQLPITRHYATRARQNARIAALCLLTACSGTIESAPDDPRWQGSTKGDVDSNADSKAADEQRPIGSLPAGAAALKCAEAPLDPGPSPLRLLSREQYVNTLRDLFGDAAKLDGALASTSPPSAFGLLQADISQVEIEQFQKAAEAVAAAAVADKARFSTLAPCASAEDRRNCAREFIRRFGTRAYRAPLTDAADIDRHLKLYDAGAKLSYERGIELTLRGMLQAPRFLYRVELGSGEQVNATAVRLSDYELAARLSYVFWKTLPDDVLAAAAAAGQLHTAAQLRAQLERMLQHPKGKSALREFLASLVQLDELYSAVKDEAHYPEWKQPALRSAMIAQARRFFDHVLSSGGTLRALLTSQTVFYERHLASYYGQTGSDVMQSLERADGSASGLLTLPALLSLHAKPDESSPINRGKFVRETLLCQQLPAPPANIPKPPEVEPDVSTRERLRQHEVNPSCSGCHKLLDPIGFAFEHFDAIGRYRTQDGGKLVDDSGEIFGTRDVNGKFEGMRALGERLAESREVEECISRQWFRFALGRFEQDADACLLQRLDTAFSRADGSLHALPTAIVESDAFLHRRPIEVAP